MSNTITLTKPKFKMSKREMLQFNDDCERIAYSNPHLQKYVVEDRDILLGDISPKKLVGRWSQALGGLAKYEGEDEDDASTISIDAEVWIKEYREYRIKKRAWKLLKKESYKSY